MNVDRVGELRRPVEHMNVEHVNIEHVNFDSVGELSRLVVHVVGARKAEVELAKSWLLFPNRLPNLR